jgi:hypothetical protein
MSLGVVGAASAVFVIATIARAHPGHDAIALADRNAPARGGSSGDALPKGQVQITERDGYRYITSNGIPNHPTGQFPNRGNPNRIAAQEYKFRVPLEPEANAKPTSIRHDLFGVAINGVPFDPGTAEFWNGDRRSIWNYEALTGAMDLGIDQNKAHVQPGGVYHYHGIPTGLIDAIVIVGGAKTRAMKGASHDEAGAPPAAAKDAGAARPMTRNGAMVLVGWGADGFPIYGPMAHAKADDASSALRAMKSSYKLKQGERPGGANGPGGTYDGSFTADFEYVKGSGDLDECNGRTGVTPEYPKGTYYYVLTDEFPFIPRFWRGTPDDSFLKRGGPGAPGGAGGPDGPRGPSGRRPPPRGGPGEDRSPPPFE